MTRPWQERTEEQRRSGLRFVLVHWKQQDTRSKCSNTITSELYTPATLIYTPVPLPVHAKN